MSADNWRECARCSRQADTKKSKQRAKAAESYGKVAIEEFLKIKAKADEPVELEPTFREDYQIGTTIEGEFHVNYLGRCTTCGFTVEFEHRKDAKP